MSSSQPKIIILDLSKRLEDLNIKHCARFQLTLGLELVSKLEPSNAFQ